MKVAAKKINKRRQGTIGDISERLSAEQAGKRADDALLNAEEELKAIFDGVKDGIALLDITGKVIKINKRVVEVGGYTEEEIVGKRLKLLKMFTPPSIAKMLSVFAKTISGQQVPPFEVEVYTKNGEKLNLEIHGSLFKKGEKVVGVVAITRDITERKKAEEELRESEEKLQYLINNTQDIIFHMDLEGNYIFGNKAAEWITGYPLDKLLKMNMSELIAPEYQRFVFGQMKERIAVKSLRQPFDFEIVHKDGHRVTLELTATGIHDRNGELIGVQGIARDITDRKRAEEALKESEERYRTLVESSTDAILIMDKERNVLTCNQAFLHLFGYKKREIEGKSIRIIHRSDKSFRAFGDSAYPVIERVGSFRGEWEFVRQDGTIFPVETVTSAIKSPDGSIRGYIATIRDITERRQAEHELQKSERRFKDIVENALEWIWEVDTKGKYTYASPVVEKILGYKPKEILKKHFYDLFPPEDREELKKAAFEVFAKKQPFREFMNRNVRKDGKIVWLSTSGVPMLDEKGNLLGYRGADIDITERKRAEEALQESEERYRTLFEQSRDAIYITTREGKFIDANQSMLDLFGYTREEMTGLNARQIYFDPKDGRRFQKEIEQKGFVRDYEVKLRKKDGTEMDCLFNVGVRRANDGSVLTYQGIIRDITERKRIEEAIVRAKREWESTFDTIEEIIFLTDAEERIKRVNWAMARKIGVEPRDLIGKSCQEALSCSHAGTERCHLWRIKMKKALTPCELEFPSLGIWARATAYPSYASDGKLDYIVHIYRDITEEKEAEEALRKTEERLRIILQGASDGFTYVDRNGVIRFVNDRMKEILADPHPEGKPISAFYDEENQKILARHLKQRWKGKGTVYETVLTDLTGQKHYLLVSGTPSRNKDNVIQGAFGIYQDMTQEKETQKALLEYEEALNRSFFGTAEALSKVIENRDPYTSGHSAGVARLATAMARMMGFPEEEVTGIYISGILHDIGKMAVPVEILVKPGRLTELEMTMIRMHPQEGYDILKEIDFPWPVSQITLQHHERMDGSGYPQGLKGEEITLEARIMAVADVVDAMTHHRPYRPAFSLEETMEELSQGRGRLYDPQVVDVCLKVLEKGQPLSPQSIR
ncbi:MAG: PAS domain S-box protein [Deltaproteobacteria bacterium]|nr:PAS domain S-box protein [Deltaproteobacteria bacterium]